MRLLGTGVLTQLIEREEAQNPKQGAILREALKAWRAEVRDADWTKTTDVQAQFSSADHVKNNRMVFNICGNKYRLVVQFNYRVPIARVKFAGTHKEYDAIADITQI
ncbi:type II toxin-antitoxin system HigB family toxin [Terasakiella sp. A23]|uniref:type II toxin-antitoxin system HigB family toxin n=1 Tax=Terasakiella sp. FCG-A23 TaxID=3080561 RepID=UPI002952F4A7|nr:type II toxin-antitoxin system HigB family toxin [Terasakiella sp. A23]MDV7339162.1 type II toxin-antitoxin system HigB family toxin [Terasakiella sp. A23]